MRPALPFLLTTASLLLLCGPGSPPRAEAEEIFSKEDNYSLVLPTGWTKTQPGAGWEKDGIKVGARRLLEKLDDGKPAQGEGAQMHLSRVPAPEGKSLADLGADPAQREFLLRFYGKPEAWPVPESEETKVKGEGEGEIPAWRLSVEGKSVNPVSQSESKCYGHLLLVLTKKHLLRLRLLAWTTPDDAEGLHYELDRIWLDFQVIDASVEKPKEVRPQDPEGAPPEDQPEGDSAEDKVVANKLQGWSFTKPKGLVSRALNKVKNPYTEAAVGGNDRAGYAEMVLSVYPNGLVVDGRQQAPQDIRKWCTTSFWQQVLGLCPGGALETFPWPRQKPNGTFLTLPDLSKPEVLVAADKKRPVDLDEGDLLKKPRVAEEAKGTLGDQRVSEAYRANLRGNRKDAGGHEVTMRFAWRTPKYTYMLSATIGRDGEKRFAPLLRTVLESFEIAK